MSTEAIRLRFESGLHLGRGAEELDKTSTSYSSDALKSALFAVGIAYYPEWAQHAEAFFEGFRISSAYPFCGEDYFLPKPVGMSFQFEKANDLTDAKQAKKISYISKDLFSRWAKDPDIKIGVFENQVGDDQFLFKNNDARKFLHTTVQQRVAVTPEGGDSRPFYFERLFFEQNSGLYFLIEFYDESLRPKLLHSLNLLGAAGIGTDRTVGNGQFVAEAPSNFQLPTGSKKNMQMAMGLYLPTRDEIDAVDMEQSNWSLVRRGGYMAASSSDDLLSLRKNNIYFFGEGSTFKTTKRLKGRYVDLQPKWNKPGMHPVWRCGMPIFITL